MATYFLTTSWRDDFPAFKAFEQQGLTWLDSAATSQKPVSVIETVADYYQQGVANVHRAQHPLGKRITSAFEQARYQVAQFLGASFEDHIVFTRNTTESINLIAYGIESKLPSEGEIVISALEHHANLLPWQQLAKRKGFKLSILPLTPEGIIDLNAAEAMINARTRLVAVSQMSNVLGTLQPIKSLIALAKKWGAVTVIDGAQGIVHQSVNVKDLDCDFYTFSGHKLFAPEGVGVLYGKKVAFDQLKHWQLGGEMVQEASYQASIFRSAPLGFEAGTPSISAVLGLKAALEYLCSIDVKQRECYETSLFAFLLTELKRRKGVVILGCPDRGLVSFYVKDVHPADLGQLFTEQSIAVRSGQHCCMPLYQSLNLVGATRVSLALYNNKEDIQCFLAALDKSLELLQ